MTSIGLEFSANIMVRRYTIDPTNCIRNANRNSKAESRWHLNEYFTSEWNWIGNMQNHRGIPEKRNENQNSHYGAQILKWKRIINRKGLRLSIPRAMTVKKQASAAWISYLKSESKGALLMDGNVPLYTSTMSYKAQTIILSMYRSRISRFSFLWSFPLIYQ